MDEFTGESDKKHLIENWWGKTSDPTSTLVSKQCWWILTHTLLAAVFAFIINFSVGCLLFLGTSEVHFFAFPKPNCLMLALTMMVPIDQKIWWSLGNGLMCGDVIVGNVPPLKGSTLFYWPKQDSKWYWYVDFTSFRIKPKVPQTLCGSICDSNFRNLPYELVANLILIPTYAGFCYLIYGPRGYPGFRPEVLVGLFGVLQMVVCVPFWALNVLASIGDRLEMDREGGVIAQV